MLFKDLCDFLQSVKEVEGYKNKTQLCSDFLDKCRSNLPQNTGEGIFPILRLMVPKLDRERTTFNMKEAKISRIIIKMLDLSAGHDKNLLSKSQMAGTSCEFADIAYSVIRKYIRDKPSILTVDEVNSFLDDITKRKSESEAEQIMLKVFRKLSPNDCKWFIRIILRNLNLGIDGNRLLNCYHPDAADLYSTNNNLKSVCVELTDKSSRLHELEVKLFEPFRPMLSKRVDASNFQKCFREGEDYFVENKFDGERFQLHYSDADGKLKYFSRNGFDYSYYFGADFTSGILSPKLKSIFFHNVKNIILDGEMMLYNKKTGKMGSKGMNLDVKKLDTAGTYQPCFCVYDILLINDQVLSNRPIKQRLTHLNQFLSQNIAGVIVLSENYTVSSREDIVKALNESVDKEEEGLVLKSPNSIYKYSDRNSGWFKIKMEYFTDVMNDLDLILMGASYASSNTDKLNTFFVGIRSGNTNNGKPCFISFGKVHSGLNDEQISYLDSKFKNDGRKFGNENSQMIFGKETPHYVIDPEKTNILLVRATELIRSDNSYKTHYTLRFPRVLAIRDDKPVDECMDINELLQLCQQNKSVIKLNKRYLDLDEVVKDNQKVKRKKNIQYDMQNAELNVKQKLDIFNGFNICVLTGTEKRSKESLENIITAAGGKVIYHLPKGEGNKTSTNIDILIVGKSHKNLNNLIKEQHKFDIIDVKWLQNCINEGESLPYEQDNIHYLGYNFRTAVFKENVDKYGDSFIELANPESLKRTFDLINVDQLVHYEKDEELFKFSKYLVYFDKFEIINDKNSETIYNSFLDELDLKYCHGKIAETLNEDVNLIIYNNPDRLEILQSYVTDNNLKNMKIVHKNFLISHQ